MTVDFSDVDAEALGDEIDSVNDVLERLANLHTSTRMQILATQFPELYAGIAKLDELTDKLFKA